MPTIRFEEVHPNVETHRDDFLKSLRVDPARWREDQEFEMQPGMTPLVFEMRCELPASLQKTIQWIVRITREAGSWRFMVGDHVWAAYLSEGDSEEEIRSAIGKLPEDVTGLNLLSRCSRISAVRSLGTLKNLTSLNLSYCVSLTDLSALSELKNLTSLNLSYCSSLTDVSGLAGLKNLTNLNLSRCSWIPDVSALGALKNLISLDLYWCGKVTDVSALGELKNLTSLSLSECSSLTDVSALGELKDLTSLDLSGCRFLTDVSALGELKNLTSLNLSYCSSLTDVSALGELKNLTSLNLGFIELTDVSALGELRNLTSLKLSRWKVTDVSSLGELKNLTSLDLSECRSLTDLSALSELRNLTSLYLIRCENLTDVSALGELKNLTSLDLCQCHVLTDVSALGELKNLTSFRVELGRPTRSAGTIAHIDLMDVSALGELKNLTSLELGRCQSLTDVSALGELKSLTSLNLSQCDSLTDVSALSKLKNLTTLKFNGHSLTDVSSLGELKNLTSLDLSECKSLTDLSALGGLKNLTSLSLSECSSLTDVSVLGKIKNLTSLNLPFCKSLTDVSVLGELKNLTSLNLNTCERLRKLAPLSSLRHLKSLNITDCGRINSVAPLREIPALREVRGWRNPDQTSELLAHTAVLRADWVFINKRGGKWCDQFLKMNEATLDEWEQFATTLGEALSLLGESPELVLVTNGVPAQIPHEESYEDCLRGKPELKSARPWKAWFSGTRKVSGWELMKNRVERQELAKASPGFVGGVCASLAGEAADKDEQDWARGWLGKMEEAWSKRGKELVPVAAEICVGLLRCNMEEEQKNWLERFTDDSDPALLDPVQVALGNWQLERDQFDKAHEHANAIEKVALRDPLLVELAKRYVSVRPARAGEILLTIGSAQLRKELMETLAREPDFVAEPANVECLVVACGDSAESLAKLIEILPPGTDHTLMEELSLCARKKAKDFSALRRRCLERLLEECS